MAIKRTTSPSSKKLAAKRTQAVRLTAERVERKVGDVEPAPLRAYYVVVNNRRYPPTQAMALATGRRPAEIRTAVALKRLSHLGFPTGRVAVSSPSVNRRDARRSPRSDRRAAFEAELRRHVGEWVATRGDELLVAAPDARSVITWLGEHDERADSMYKVPRDLSEVSGTAA
jgi:hypothetical protein